MPNPRKTILRLLGLAAGAAGAVAAAVWLVEMLEARNQTRVVTALEEVGVDWATVATDGMVARVSGIAPDEVARFHALKAAGTAINPAFLADAMTVAPPADLPPPAFRLELLRAGPNVTAVGLVPGAPTAAAALAARIAGAGEDAPFRVEPLVKTSPDPAPEHWSTTLDLALAALAGLDPARIDIGAETLAVTGRAAGPAEADAIAALLERGMPAPVALELEIDRPRPVVSPFTAHVQIGPDARTFETCMARDATGLAVLRTAARAAELSGAEACALAIGAPTPDWERVVATGIGALAAAGGGTLTVADLNVTLTLAAEARSDDPALDSFAARLPVAYTLDLRRPERPSRPGGDEPEGPPAFSATLSPEGLAQLRGPVAGRASRTVLQSYAAARFAGADPHLSLRDRPGLPEGWQIRVLAALDALAELDSGRARVTPDQISVTGRSGEAGARLRVGAALTAALGPSARIELDIAYDPELAPTAGLPLPEDCLADIGAIQAAQKITFAPGATELDADALAVVARIAEVLRDCDRVAVIVGGHTDSQGRAEMNADLSKSRAEAVVAALVDARVLPGTLDAVGYGETRPVADNDTEAGREANRRIEFALRRPLFGPEVPEPKEEETDTAEVEAQEVEADGAD